MTECDICFELYDESELMTLSKCQHSHHRACLSEHCQTQIEMGRLPTCPMISCLTNTIGDTDLDALALQPRVRSICDTLRKRQEDLADKKRLTFCPTPDCACALYTEHFRPGSGDLLTCPDCGRTTSLYSTRIPPRRSWRVKQKQGTLKACPHCGLWTSRNGGCHHITCTACQYHWCWLCHAEVQSNHYNIPDTPCYNLMYYTNSARRVRRFRQVAGNVVALGLSPILLLSLLSVWTVTSIRGE